MSSLVGSRRWRIALAHPTFWPEVRRGSERLISDLAGELASRGHAVTVLTSHRGAPSLDSTAGFEVQRVRRPRSLPPLRHYEDHLESAPAMLMAARRGGFDLLHSFQPGWNYPAARAARWLGIPVVATTHGIPLRGMLVARRYRLEMQAAVIERAAAHTVLSEAAAELMERYFLERPLVLPGGVRLETFANAAGERALAPTLISAASLGDPRKRADLIFAAFERVRARVADARLLVVGTTDPHMSRTPVELPEGASWIDGDRTADLAAAYGSAWASVLAADHEGFGLVLLESMAAGTPVIAARSGGPAELLDEGVGWGFPPDQLEPLAARMEEALSRPPSEAMVERCRARAGEFDWARVGDLYEDLYRHLISV